MNPVVIDISDDANEDWLRTVRKEMEAETAPEPVDALAPAKAQRRAEKLAAFTKKK